MVRRRFATKFAVIGPHNPIVSLLEFFNSFVSLLEFFNCVVAGILQFVETSRSVERTAAYFRGGVGPWIYRTAVGKAAQVFALAKTRAGGGGSDHTFAASDSVFLFVDDRWTSERRGAWGRVAACGGVTRELVWRAMVVGLAASWECQLHGAVHAYSRGYARASPHKVEEPGILPLEE